MQPLVTKDGSPPPGTRAARPRYPRGGYFAGRLSRVERLERQLASVRWQRDRWQRRYQFARRDIARLEARRTWVERYVGFRVEYRIRGWWRGLRRRYRVARRWLAA